MKPHREDVQFKRFNDLQVHLQCTNLRFRFKSRAISMYNKAVLLKVQSYLSLVHHCFSSSLYFKLVWQFATTHEYLLEDKFFLSLAPGIQSFLCPRKINMTEIIKVKSTKKTTMQILWKLKAKYMCFQYTEEKKLLRF